MPTTELFDLSGRISIVTGGNGVSVVPSLYA
jgi:hypothetical protein